MRLELAAGVVVGAVFGIVAGCGGTSGSGAADGNSGSRWITVDAGGAGVGGHGGDAGPDAGAICGSVRCATGMVCCNAGCGICTPSGGGCVAGCPADTDCAQTIDQYCGTDASTCPFGVPRDWNAAKQEAPSLCLSSRDNVYFEVCGRYGILNGGGVDDDTISYYDLATLQLVRVKHNALLSPFQCLAGIELPDLNCPPDALPASLCIVPDAGVD